jgi:hypothetical protein
MKTGRCEHKVYSEDKVEKRGRRLYYVRTRRCSAVGSVTLRRKPGYMPWDTLEELHLCDTCAAERLQTDCSWDKV